MGCHLHTHCVLSRRPFAVWTGRRPHRSIAPGRPVTSDGPTVLSLRPAVLAQSRPVDAEFSASFRFRVGTCHARSRNDDVTMVIVVSGCRLNRRGGTGTACPLSQANAATASPSRKENNKAGPIRGATTLALKIAGVREHPFGNALAPRRNTLARFRRGPGALRTTKLAISVAPWAGPCLRVRRRLSAA